MTWLSGLEHIAREQEPLAAHTWLRLGGPAEFFTEPTTVEELATVVVRCHENGVPLRLIGSGSNVLAPDEGVPGMIISLSAPAFGQIKVVGQDVVAGGGAKLAHVISSSVREGLAGLEPLVGIPGTVGAALHANTGSRTHDVGQWLHQATVLMRTGETITREREQMRFSYRDSSLNELAILSATFRLEQEDATELNRRMQKLWILKRSSHPTGQQGACYVFKDPLGMTADELIEQHSLKGTAVGGAQIHDRDANFIVIGDGTTSSQVKELIDQVQSLVLEQSGVSLETSLDIW